MPKIIVEGEKYPLLLKPSFLAHTIGYVDSNAFRFLYLDAPQGPRDEIFDGNLACAYFVSTVLRTFELLEGSIQSFVKDTIPHLVPSGWERCDEAGQARLVIWADRMAEIDGLSHPHIGICIDNEYAVSNFDAKKSPQIHGIYDGLLAADGTPREAVAFYKHPDLEADSVQYGFKWVDNVLGSRLVLDIPQ